MTRRRAPPISGTIMARLSLASLVFAAFCAGALAQTPQQEWLFDDNPDEPMLVYGTPDSDDVVIAITCEPKNKIVQVSAFLGSDHMRPGMKATVRLTAGTTALDIIGDAVANEMDGGTMVTARGAPQPRLFALFKAGPTLRIDVPGNAKTVPLTSAAPHAAALEKLCLGQR